MTSDIGLTTSKQSVLVTHHQHQGSERKAVVPLERKKDDNNEDYTSTTLNNVQNGQQVRHLEPRPFRPFKSSEEYLYAMKEDLAEWLNALYNLNINVDNFMEKLETGVILCRHANNIIRKARANPTIVNQSGTSGSNSGAPNSHYGSIPIEKELSFRTDVNPGTFHARDNVSNFIAWCRKLGIMECLLFETDDLVLRKNEKSFILCLLEIARQGTKIGMIAPMLVQLEQEIDREIAQDAQSSEDDKLSATAKDNPSNQSIATPTARLSDANKENRKEIESLKNLHEMVVDILSRCSCPSKFPMVKVADGKYRIGDTKVLIFVRILRNHVMVRVGGGWDTLGHYLDRHDPCRCRAGHRFSTSAKVTFTEGDPSSGPQMVVTYNRPEDPVSTSLGQVNGNNSINNGNHLINRGNISSNHSPNHNLKRRASGTSDYLNGGGVGGSGQPIVGTSNSSKCSNGRLARRDSITNHHANTVEITPRFPSSISTSSTLSSSSSTSSSGYPDGLLIDRQESRTSHYSDDSTDTSSIIMESPSPTQQLDSQSDDGDQQSTIKLTSQNSSTINKTSNPTTGLSKINKTRGNYHDSSSSEFSESEINHNSGNNLLGGGSSRRRCSPRKIMKKSDLLGTEKPSWASDDFILDDKDSIAKPDGRDSRIDRIASANVSSSPFQRNCRYRRSEQKISTRGTNGYSDKASGLEDGSKNKSRSSEDLSQVDSASGKMNWKNPINGRTRAAHSISSSPARNKVSSPKRGISELGKETPMSCFERGRNYYASLPRSRSSSQSSRTPLTTDLNKTPLGNTASGASPFVRGSPGRYSLNTPRGSLPESISLSSCRSDRFGYGLSSVNGRLSRQNSTESGETIRTWAFKSRTRPSLDPDLFTKPCDSSRSSFRYGNRPTTATTTPGQRSRSSDSSPSRVPLHTLVKVTNGRSIVTSKPAVKLINQFNGCETKSSSMIGDANNNHFNDDKDFNDNNTKENTAVNHDGDQLIALQNDILKKMETLVNQYQARVERATPCKIVNSSESINLESTDFDDGKPNESVINCSHQRCNSSKIPMPIRATPRKEF